MTGASNAQAQDRLKSFDLFIDGRFQPALSGQRFVSQDPFTGEGWASVADAGFQDVEAAVASASRSLKTVWAGYSGSMRARLMWKLADIVERDMVDLARMETRDNGKVRRDAEAQVAGVAVWLRYFAGLADKIEGQAFADAKADHFVYTRREPVGVVAAILPWNAPLILMVAKLAPALSAGCTFVAKPSEFTPASVLAFAGCVEEAGFPPGVFNVIASSSREIGACLAAHPDVARVAFTGSTQTGIAVAKAAAQNVARVSLELGGKSPQLIFADSDLDAAVNGTMAGVFAASGQMCHAGARVFVQRSVHDEFITRLSRRAESVRLGDPGDNETDMGPISTQPQFDRINMLIRQARQEGATIHLGGKAREGGGYFIEPTILTNVAGDHAIAREEVFGPVVIVTAFDDEDDAVTMANDTKYGLAAGIWTNDLRRAHRVAARIEAGTIWINCYRAVSPAVPFGGNKLSGLGRENGADALLDYLETKAVWIELSGNERDPFRM